MDKNKITEIAEETEEIVELIADDGTKNQFYHLGTMDYEGKKYAFFQPAEDIEGSDPDDVVIFEIDEKNSVLLPVENEELLQKIFDRFVVEYEGEYAGEGDEEYIN